MKLLIIHFSDIHLKSTGNVILERKGSILTAIQNHALEADVLYIVVSGDIAYSGQQDEYEHAMTLLDYLKKELVFYSKKPIHILMAPGNHDCDYSTRTIKARDMLIKQLQKSQDEVIDESIKDTCCEVQNNYFFFSNFYIDSSNAIINDKLLLATKYDLNGFSIVFNCFNTSWLSQINEQYGRLHFPINLYKKDLSITSDLTISILHHPFSWQDPDHVRNFRVYLEEISDLIVTGHEHQPDKRIIDNLNGNIIEYIEGHILQDNEDETNSGFNLLAIDLDGRVQQIRTFRWNGQYYSAGNVDSQWIPYYKSSAKKDGFEINSAFRRKLNDAGASFNHPEKSEILLEDFFVFPTLRSLKVQKIKEAEVLHDTISSSTLLKITSERAHILLIGDEKSGRTSLCRVLFKNYLQQGYLPLLIDGSMIKSSSLSDFQSLVNKIFGEQYSRDILERFSQTENAKKVLFIDDIDKSRLNFAHKSLLVSRIEDIYPYVVMTASDTFQLEEIVYDESGHTTAFGKYKWYEILEFGHVLRSKLISKWNLIGREDTVENHDLVRMNDKSTEIMDTIIGRNFVPSRPLFLLTILQSIEIGTPHNLKESSYGYYYEFLIIQALIKINVKPDEIDAYNTYLTELAYVYFRDNVNELTSSMISEFHDWFRSEYTTNRDLNEYDQNLIRVSILDRPGGNLSFKYRYVFYFFVARYLANNITVDSIRNRISEMSKRVYKEEFANIIMFLTHLSKDPYILDEIIKNAKALFSDSEPMTLEADLDLINSLSDEIPQLILEHKDVTKVRESKLELQDQIEMSEKSGKKTPDDFSMDDDAAANSLDIINRLNLSIKTIEIVGQILKNYHGSLKGTVKFSLCEEAYFIGLRALRFVFSIFEDKRDFLINAITETLNRKKIVDKIDIERVSKRILFFFFCFISFAMIKRISGSVGSENLAGTFENVVIKNASLAVRLIDLAIKLDYFKGIPFENIKKLIKDIPKNGLQYVVIQKLILDYLYMFPADYKDKQRICELAGITMDTQRAIDHKSTQRKREY